MIAAMIAAIHKLFFIPFFFSIQQACRDSCIGPNPPSNVSHVSQHLFAYNHTTGIWPGLAELNNGCLYNLTGMLIVSCKTDCFGKTGLVPHVPSSS